MACLVEASCEKPGNVTPTRQFGDLAFVDFLHAAVLMGAVFGEAERKEVGETVLDAATQIHRNVRTNTSIGTALLLAPLAHAYYRKGKLNAESARATLAALSVKDAALAYRALRLANPGGLGRSSAHDVRKRPTVTLLRAMKLAADRDWIAYEYAHNYSITFDAGAPELAAALDKGLEFRDAVTHTYLRLLYLYPDSHIARRNTPALALQVSEMAGQVLGKGGMHTAEGRRAAYEFDHQLRSPDHHLNPGSTADLTAAALFVHFINHGYQSLHTNAKPGAE